MTPVPSATPRAALTPEEEPLVSIVFLLKQPRVHRTAALQKAVQGAFRKPATLTEATPETTRIAVDGWTLLNHHVARPYVEKPVAGVPAHRGWLSVDVIDQPADAPRVAAYQQIGRLLAELGGPDVVAIFHPESGRLQPYRPEALRLLRLNPLVDLGFEEEPATTRVDRPDPAMLAAEAEARRRFPEFRARFERHPAGEDFYVKTSFEDEEHGSEFMWVVVDKLQATKVQGRLANDPEYVQGVKLGDQVEIPLDKVEDWNVLDARGEMVAGGFTVKVLMQREAAKPGR